ncbi:hypothetical protein [Flagellimonas sp.]|uniref:hypothetical protein n=1 Tax=Flagellimonas sp. TaxID=2058762 RepID=UPI003F4A68EE
MNVGIKHIGTLLFTGLLLLKVSAFHVYEHHDKHEDKTHEHENECELCFLTFFFQQSDILTADFDSIQTKVVSPVFQDPIITLDSLVLSGLWETYFLSRPPPSLS